MSLSKNYVRVSTLYETRTVVVTVVTRYVRYMCLGAFMQNTHYMYVQRVPTMFYITLINQSKIRNNNNINNLYLRILITSKAGRVSHFFQTQYI